MSRSHFSMRNALQRHTFLLLFFFLFSLRFACGHNLTIRRNIYMKTNITNGLPKYTPPKEWRFTHIGRSGARFLQSFFLPSADSAVRTTLKNIVQQPNFMKNTLNYIFRLQIGISVVVALGFLCCISLWFLPCLIAIWKQKQVDIPHGPTIERMYMSSTIGYMLMIFLSFCVALVLFGMSVMVMGANEMKERIPDLFDFGLFTMDTALQLRDILYSNFQFGLADISRGAFEVIKMVYDVSDEIGIRFMAEMYTHIRPVQYLAKYVEWDLSHILFRLRGDQMRMSNLITKTHSDVTNSLNAYGSALNELHAALQQMNMSTASLQPLYQLPVLQTTNTSVTSYTNPITTFEGVSRSGLPNIIQTFIRNLRQATSKPIYDPSQLIESLKHATFVTEQTIRGLISEYIDFLSPKSRTLERLVFRKAMENGKSTAFDTYFYIYFCVVFFGIISALLALCMFISFMGGFRGTLGFRLNRERDGVYKSTFSDRSGKALLLLSYLASAFLSVFWFFSIFLFILAALPTDLCVSIRDKSIFDVSLDDKYFRNRINIYQIFSSRRFNTTVKDTLQECENNPTYFGLLPDPLLNPNLILQTKAFFTPSPVREAIANEVANVTASLNINDTFIQNLANPLGDIDAKTLFSEFLNFLTTMRNTNATIKFEELKKVTNIPDKLVTLIDAAEKRYDEVLSAVTKARADESYYKTSIDAMNMTLKVSQKKARHLVWTSAGLNQYVQNDVPNIYVSLLNDTIVELIDAVFYDMEHSAQEVRNTLSNCAVLGLLYSQLQDIVCKRYTYAMSAIWMGSFFVDFFLLFSVLLSVLSLPIFLIPPAEVPPPRKIQPEQIPSTTDVELSDVTDIQSKEEEESSVSSKE